MSVDLDIIQHNVATFQLLELFKSTFTKRDNFPIGTVPNMDRQNITALKLPRVEVIILARSDSWLLAGRPCRRPAQYAHANSQSDSLLLENLISNKNGNTVEFGYIRPAVQAMIKHPGIPQPHEHVWACSCFPPSPCSIVGQHRPWALGWWEVGIPACSGLCQWESTQSKPNLAL